MTWEPEDPYADAQAGWRLKFLADPDVTNNVLTLSVMPPGGLIPIIPPPPPPGQAFAFVGISSVSVVIADTNGTAITGWGFNADQMGWMNAPPGPLPANDLLAAGGISMFNNVNHTVTINIGQGAAANTATVSGIDPMTGLQFNFAGPNFLIGGVAGNLGLTQAGSLDYYENGNLRGSVQIPGQGQVMGLVNFWDSASLVPEPGTIGLLGFGALLGLGWLGWRFARRRR